MFARLRKLMLVLSILLGFVHSVYAAPPTLLSITRSSTITFPSNMLRSKRGIEDYTITNNTGKTLNNIKLFNIAAGFKQIAATNNTTTAVKDCQSISSSAPLASGASCRLRLSFYKAGETTWTGSSPAAVVCPFGTQYLCSNIMTSAFVTKQVLPSANLVTLTAPSSHYQFVAGTTATISVKNTSNVTANNVQIALAPAYKNYITGSRLQLCPSLAANQTCTLTASLKSTLPAYVGSDSTVSINASNATTQTLPTRTASSAVAVSPVLIQEPNKLIPITVYNGGTTSISNVSIKSGSTLPSGVSEISSNGCSVVATNTNCAINLSASKQAYGVKDVTIRWDQGGSEHTDTIKVGVAKVRIAIHPDAADKTQRLFLNPAGGTISIKNKSPFAAHGLTVSQVGKGTWLKFSTVGVSSPCAPNLTIAGNSVCHVKYSIVKLNDTDDNASADAEVAGTNVITDITSATEDGTVSMGIDQDPDDLRLGYAAMIIVNGTDTSQLVAVTQDTVPSALSSNLALCDSSGSNCEDEFKSDCITASGSYPYIAAHSVCHLWYKANSSNTLSADTSSTDKIQATVVSSLNSGANTNLSQDITFTYGNRLYAGGIFSKTGDSATTLNYVGAYDGQSWYPLADGLNFWVLALAPYHGNLYAGGMFSANGNGDTSLNYAGQWNGTSWQPLSGASTGDSYNGFNSMVYAFSVLNHQLVIGGSFTDQDSSTGGTLHNAYAVRWARNDDGVYDWLAMGQLDQPIKSNAFYNNNGTFYAGSCADTDADNDVFKWSSDLSEWAATNLSPDACIRAISSYNSDIVAAGDMSAVYQLKGDQWQSLFTANESIYSMILNASSDLVLGGFFTQLDADNYYYLARYDGSLHSVGSLNNLIYDLLNAGDTIYAASDDGDKGYVVKWDGSSWSALGTGVNLDAEALAIAPHIRLS